MSAIIVVNPVTGGGGGLPVYTTLPVGLVTIPADQAMLYRDILVLGDILAQGDFLGIL